MPGNPYALAAELAAPVARGDLTLTDADTALILAAFQQHRRGSPHDPADVFRGCQHILRLYLQRHETRRGIAEMKVRRRLRPLIALRKPRNVLLAEAHGVNGAEGFPFQEPEVTTITAREVYFAGRQRHG